MDRTDNSPIASGADTPDSSATQPTFTDFPLMFSEGFAGIDRVTLRKLADNLVRERGYGPITVPQQAVYDGTSDFDDLATIIESTGSITALIDTKKMVWDENLQAYKHAFSDYTGALKRSIGFKHASVVKNADTTITRAAVELENGNRAFMWFAELPVELLQQVGTYQMFDLVARLIELYLAGPVQIYDVVSVPAQMIQSVRRMSEINALNPQLGSINQSFREVMDETGARVAAATSMRTGLPPVATAPTQCIFGEHGGVMFWLTSTDQASFAMPFAISVTLAEAWLAPDQTVSFDFQSNPGQA